MGRFVKFFLGLLYQPLAYFYNFVAFIVSMGRWTNWVESVQPYIEGPAVLELGFGPGHLQETLAKSYTQCFGIDLSYQMAKISLSRLRKVGVPQKLAQANAMQLPFPVASFDCLISTFPTNYVISSLTILDAKRVLKPSGKWVILPAAWIIPNSIKNSLFHLLFNITGQSPKWNSDWTIPFINGGFKIFEENWVSLKDSKVLIIVLEPIL